MKRRALLSVFNKDGILPLASFLTDEDWEIISTGGTARYLSQNGIPIIPAENVTNFPECLAGRVKTLHPAIHAGILARRNERSHIETLKTLEIAPIDLVCVNLYPFIDKARETPTHSLDEMIEFIDIGGPSMLRSAAKNCRDVIVLCEASDYGWVMRALKTGSLSERDRLSLAAKVFSVTAYFDTTVAAYLKSQAEGGLAFTSDSSEQQNSAHRGGLTEGKLRYGENSHQSAMFSLSKNGEGAFKTMTPLGGKELSYNNICDADLAWKTVCAFGLSADGTPPLGENDVANLLGPAFCGQTGEAACVAVKHNTPCGVALGKSALEAFRKARACDEVSIFGGIVAFNTMVDVDTAKVLTEIFLEIVIAPDFTDDALDILHAKKNLRILKAPRAPSDRQEFHSVDGGILTQDVNTRLLEKWDVVTKAPVEERDIADMLFGLRAVSFVKSNAIVVVKDRATVGIGGGQTNRIWACEAALSRAEKMTPRVLASDAFFPFPDCVELAAEYGIKAIIQSGGSLNDKQSIEAADKHGIAMVCTGIRYFKH